MSEQDKKDNDQDYNLFRQIMADVKPIKQDKIDHYRPARSTQIHKKTSHNNQHNQDQLSEEHLPYSVTSEDILKFQRSGLQHKVMRKLARGEYPIEAELDLHNMSIPQARQQIHQFIHTCSHYRLQCVRVIHGNGQSIQSKYPILKNHVNQWLRQYSQVLAFVTTQSKHGGKGAVYVYLKLKKH